MKYVCQICGYIYDDTKEKVPFEQLPADWKCPLCGAAKVLNCRHRQEKDMSLPAGTLTAK